MNITHPFLAFMPLLAQLGGSSTGLLNKLFVFLIVALVFAILFAGGYWALGKIPKAAPTAQLIWMCLFVLVGMIILINFLLSLIGHQFISW